MSVDLKPLKTENLPDRFIEQFEELILSGAFPIGEKLPPERELALKLGVSRPVVHQGLLDLEHKGLVKMIPRVGTVINDYRKEGSLTLLNSLLRFQNRKLDPAMLRSLLEVRVLFEVENARLAAQNRNANDLAELESVISTESGLDRKDTASMVNTDFSFHLTVAVATGNLVYPMLINSFRTVYTDLTSRFFALPGVPDTVFPMHRSMVTAIKEQNSAKAASLMKKLLKHGEENLLNAYKNVTEASL